MSYENDAHGGSGKSQSKLNKSAGSGRGKTTRHAERIPHAMQSHDGCYEADAHTEAHHGKGGRAVGRKGDSGKPGPYSTKLQGEGAGRLGGDEGPTFVPAPGHGTTAKAHHHPKMSGEPHRFSSPSGKEAHSFGHPAHLRQGPHRLSGHKGAHRIGRK